MAREWTFSHGGTIVRIRNSIFDGAKLYVNGDFRDKDNTLFSFGDVPLLSASLPGGEILEVYARSRLFSVEIKAVARRGSHFVVVFDSAGSAGVPVRSA